MDSNNQPRSAHQKTQAHAWCTSTNFKFASLGCFHHNMRTIVSAYLNAKAYIWQHVYYKINRHQTPLAGDAGNTAQSYSCSSCMLTHVCVNWHCGQKADLGCKAPLTKAAHIPAAHDLCLKRKRRLCSPSICGMPSINVCCTYMSMHVMHQGVGVTVCSRACCGLKSVSVKTT